MSNDDRNNVSDGEQVSSDDGDLSDASDDQDTTTQTQVEPDSLEDDDDDSFDGGIMLVDENVGVRWGAFSRIEQSPTH